MPRIANGNLRTNAGLKGLSADLISAADAGAFPYNYPNGLDLRPGTPLHDRIVADIIASAQESYDVMASRRTVFKKIDDKLTAFIDLDDKERELKAKDSRKPASIVIPLSYAVLQTILTYWVNTFSQQEVLFPYEGTGPEDEYGTILLEKIIAFQSRKFKHLLALRTMWRSALAYGIGAVTPVWVKRTGFKSVPQAIMIPDPVTGQMFPLEFQRNTVETVLAEGNDILPIDPYTYLPDPNVSAHRPQDSEFMGWVERTNLMRVLSEEAENPETLFNAQYVKLLKQPTSAFVDEIDTRRDRTFDEARGMVTSNLCDRIHMYRTLIPAEYEIGASTKPQKYLITVTGDRILQRLQPLGLDHNMYPIAVCAPEFDGFSASPLSSVETVYGCQELVDFLMNSHVANIRKALNDMLVVDPYLININDLKTPGPGKIIRMRRSAWGRGVNDGVKQLAVADVTAGNINDISFINQIVQQITGASDIIQGIQRRSSERVTRAEVVNTQQAALSRIEHGARMGALMAHHDLAYMMASQTQQFMSKELMLKTTGRWEDTLRDEYGAMGTVTARPIDIQVDFDVLPQDAPMKGGEYIDAWTNIFQTIGQSEVLSQNFDMVRIFKHVARLMGAKDLSEFAVRPAPQVQVVPDDILNQRIQQGRYASVEQM